MRTRSKRTFQRVPLHRIRPNERDVWILEGLAKMRFLTTSQMGKLYFGGSRWSANKRLRKLLDAGLITVWVRSLSQDNIYSLTRKGLEGFFEKTVSENSPIKIPRELDGNLNHLLGINEVRIALALGFFPAGGKILWWKSDWELRTSKREQLIPDAIFTIRWENGNEQAYALELDNRSKSPRNFLKKIVGYASRKFQRDGMYSLADATVLVVGTNSKWLERYRLAAGAVGIRIDLWFTTLEDLKTKRSNDAIWQPSNSDEKYSLRDLSFFPYSKDGRAYENVVFQGT
jgi:hypothetical protein